jgi:hypothetical protein
LANVVTYALRLQQPTASGAPETQDNVEQLDITRLSTNPHDVEDPDQLRIFVEVETQDAAARPEHGLGSEGRLREVGSPHPGPPG